MSDISLWEEFKSSIKPLTHRKIAEQEPIPLPPRLRVTRKPMAELLYQLDLHGFTVEVAHTQLKKFIIRHQNVGTLKVIIITGKGLKTTGVIKKEIMNWLDTSFFTDKVRSAIWKNDGGALELTLKRIKKW